MPMIDVYAADGTFGSKHDLAQSPEGGWGINGHANTGAGIADAARHELAGH